MREASRTQPHVSHFFNAFWICFSVILVSMHLSAKMPVIFLYSYVREEYIAYYCPQIQVP